VLLSFSSPFVLSFFSFLDATMAGGSSTPSSSSGGRPLLVGGVLVNPPPRRGILPPVSRAAAAAAARAPPAAARASSRSPSDGSRPIGPAARTARHVVGAAAAAAGPAAAAVAAAPAAGCTDERSVGRQTLKLAGEKPYDCPMLGLTEEDVRFLKALVPSTVKSCFVLRLTFMQQDPVVRARAIVYLERKVPSLRRAENSWAAMSLLAKASDILRATKKRRERRRALAQVAADEARKERLSNIDAETRDPTPTAETGNLVFFMVHGHART